MHFLSDNARDFLVRRAAEASGCLVIAIVGALSISLATWSISDPSWNHASDGAVHNLLGSPGAIGADMVMQLFGIAIVAILTPVACWGWTLLTQRRLALLKTRLILLAVGAAAAASLASLLPITDRWPLPTGLGGVLGDGLLVLPRHLIGGSEVGRMILGMACAGIAILTLTPAAGFGLRDEPGIDEDAAPYRWVSDGRTSLSGSTDRDEAGEPGRALRVLDAVFRGGTAARDALVRAFRPGEPGQKSRDGRFAPWLGRGGAPDAPFADLEDEPQSFSPDGERREPTFAALDALSEPQAAPARQRAAVAQERPGRTSEEPATSRRVSMPGGPPKAAPVSWEREAGPDGVDFQLPSPLVLAEPRKQHTGMSEDALEQNARLLEGVLEDFGVRGEITNVRPGPVVTLYELEPAPGIKSSRVIGLADDIARSMSAVSARVAVVQGRNAIGIELPNQRRETVFLRELIAAEEFTESKNKLAIALGKTIGGDPVIVDLARMPHLLVAGTTGSGKSVAINTMILSLLYRMKPEECRLIMVDPKMLELSIYDGIPHLLTPVVTDPKKAVIALKWAVREMEERYKKMSKVGVRNIDGFNARVTEAAERGETITRTVQTGYDKETGEAVYEHETMDLAVLPYIVVVVDEMADLMMVAGKEIEGAIQRLAQMARAAGIHLIMATQRPSVDVITGTIKANFPTRISFQVTSKIDSRTILGEQGAEQLLGQGDMLYMAGGGRISRVHGPFVSDGEVEKVVQHLKAQGHPDYLDVVTVDPDSDEAANGDDGAVFDKGGFGEEGGDLYDQAVRVVLRDKKCSTSYIQRRLQVGYNKAASLVERMEKEGLVGAANHAGKREILVETDRHGGDGED
ncbi:DNA translocase FtsK 4TM domain-containing protein [Lichenihabitans sp. Uapishka_5]|uniref:FtsK/SpoIIIE family DNA translocase n=1 Tax=Lichenihabitans sp. Uapishka_5 TaxID=3037302 RepID=UPI0029E80B77|nr:DNA translocase FtsK 4TM domain-containing protein [Lichenihabitans sp. Uapishka_5]MDX7950432.1 DNA translocase FtsK 4TM domain-containing protein [Lichenihabitans sp. Uapishka_5]